MESLHITNDTGNRNLSEGRRVSHSMLWGGAALLAHQKSPLKMLRVKELTCAAAWRRCEPGQARAGRRGARAGGRAGGRARADLHDGDHDRGDRPRQLAHLVPASTDAEHHGASARPPCRARGGGACSSLA